MGMREGSDLCEGRRRLEQSYILSRNLLCLSRTGFRVGKWDECSGKWYVSFLGWVFRMLLLSPRKSDGLLMDFTFLPALQEFGQALSRLNKYALFPCNEILPRILRTLDITLGFCISVKSHGMTKKKGYKPRSKHLGACGHGIGREVTDLSRNNQAYAAILPLAFMTSWNQYQWSEPFDRKRGPPSANTFSNLVKSDVKI